MSKIDVNIFKEIPDRYITLFVDSLGRLAACNQELSSMRYKGNDWVFKNVTGLDLVILGRGYNSEGWRKSSISRPFGVKGRALQRIGNTNQRPIYIAKTGSGKKSLNI